MFSASNNGDEEAIPTKSPPCINTNTGNDVDGLAFNGAQILR